MHDFTKLPIGTKVFDDVVWPEKEGFIKDIDHNLAYPVRVSVEGYEKELLYCSNGSYNEGFASTLSTSRYTPPETKCEIPKPETITLALEVLDFKFSHKEDGKAIFTVTLPVVNKLTL